MLEYLKKCKIRGCGKTRLAKGLCRRHWQQMRRNGKILKRTKYDRNEIFISGNIANIELYNMKNKVNGIAIIDVKDVEKCKVYKWYKTSSGYAVSRIKNRTVFLHNFILDRNANLKKQIDHRNRVKLDCRKSNLRLCTPADNNHNTGKSKRNSSGFKGVSLCKKTQKWRSYLCVRDNYFCLGLFENKVVAAKVRDKMALRLHGQFAWLNL